MILPIVLLFNYLIIIPKLGHSIPNFVDSILFSVIFISGLIPLFYLDVKKIYKIISIFIYIFIYCYFISSMHVWRLSLI